MFFPSSVRCAQISADEHDGNVSLKEPSGIRTRSVLS
jgi:hypothetical protein